jgi:hypothetical protein
MELLYWSGECTDQWDTLASIDVGQYPEKIVDLESYGKYLVITKEGSVHIMTSDDEMISMLPTTI